MNVTAGELAQLKNLCVILNIPVQSTQPDPKLALKLLTLTYALPVLYRDQFAIRKAGNEILDATFPAFDKNGPFVWCLGTAIGLMQSVPAYHNNLRMTSDNLSTGYKRMNLINNILAAVGLLGGASTGGAGAAERIKTGSWTEGVKKVGGRLIGKGPISEAVVQRHGPAAGARATAGVLVVAAIANLIYQSNRKQMGEFRALMQHRYQSGKATRQEYIGVFGNAVDPSAIKKYSEYR